MPVAGGFKTAMLVPVRTTSQAATGEILPSYSYGSATTIWGKIVNESGRAVSLKHGQALAIDARFLFNARDTAAMPNLLGTNTGERYQVKIDNFLWEVVRIREVGDIPNIKEALLRAWK